MTAWRPVTTGPTGQAIARFLEDGPHADGTVLLERGVVPMGPTKAPVHSWAPPAPGSVRLRPSFWLDDERRYLAQLYMAFGVVESDEPPRLEVMVPPPRVGRLGLDPAVDAVNDAASVEAHRNGVARLSKVMSPDEVKRQLAVDLLHDVENHARLLSQRIGELLDPPTDGYTVDAPAAETLTALSGWIDGIVLPMVPTWERLAIEKRA